MSANVLTNKTVNNSRQVEYDIAKGLAILFMVLVHTNEYYQGTAYEGGVYNRIVEFFGSPPAAPIFMFLMGFGIVYSRHNAPKQLAIRGVKLLISGYVLSFVRDMIPYFILYLRENDTEMLTEGSYLLWGIDILQFAGLAFLFLSLVKKYELSNRKIFAIWCFFATLNMLLTGVSFESRLADSFFGLFWGTTDYSWFPFLNWITFPMLGYVFAGYLQHVRDKHEFYRVTFLLSASVSIPLWIYSYINNVQFGAFGELWQTAYYHHDVIGSLVMSAFTFMWLSLMYFLTPYLPKVVIKWLTRWSKNINRIYKIHYSLLGFSILFLTVESYHPAIVCLIAFIVFILSDLICYLHDKLKEKRKEKTKDFNGSEVVKAFN